MKKRGRIFYMVGAALILIIVLSAFAFSRPESTVEEGDLISERSLQSFQEYLWLENPVVLLAHVGLILVGALAVSALLPSEEEEVEP